MRHCKVVFMACALALVWGCSQQQPITDSTKNEQKGQPSQQASSIDRQKNEQNEIWKLAAQGKLKGVDLSVKSTKSEIIKKYGRPLETGNSEYGFRLRYDGFIFEFPNNFVVKDGQNEKLVTILKLEELEESSQATSIYVKPTVLDWKGTTSDVKKIFGEPDQFVDDQAYGGWHLIYTIENSGKTYHLTFSADTENGEIKEIKLS
ncbi:DUF4309 domain-containing protein [Paenibacillus elgii]|uniref:DUF4309 domain-containing protein n=1 Tax=Paenibacillus elgii TaxID=189691 RepID=UPI000248D9B4|nr:DUF4309 domain-containing protein [Paenibacillus elgii]MCM3271676.1 YjgB family protein [Paenibacillus elgii]